MLNIWYTGDIKQGGALLLAHYTDVTFGNVDAIPI